MDCDMTDDKTFWELISRDWPDFGTAARDAEMIWQVVLNDEPPMNDNDFMAVLKAELDIAQTAELQRLRDASDLDWGETQ